MCLGWEGTYGTLVLKLLGGFEAYLNDGSALALSTKSGQALLAYLALTPGRRHARDKVAALLWENRADEQARASLRQTLAVLRKALPLEPNWLIADEGYFALSPGVCEADVATFESLAKEDTERALAQAASLYGGDLLEGFICGAKLHGMASRRAGSACTNWRSRFTNDFGDPVRQPRP